MFVSISGCNSSVVQPGKRKLVGHSSNILLQEEHCLKDLLPRGGQTQMVGLAEVKRGKREDGNTKPSA